MTQTLTTSQIARFQGFVYRSAKCAKRDFAWRHTTHPYHIWLSEIMLQQTQAMRVEPKYLEFLGVFPRVEDVAAAQLTQVISLWNGLGYMRRAKHMWQAAKIICEHHQGQVPTSVEMLQTLPGIGPYTARAIATFATNQPDVVIETNIRTVFGYHFFPNLVVTDRDLEPLVQKCLDTSNPRAWYNALMDYGWLIKKMNVYGNHHQAGYRQQTKYQGSLRHTRAQVLRLLSTQSLHAESLNETIQSIYTEQAIKDLVKEGFVRQKACWLSIV